MPSLWLAAREVLKGIQTEAKRLRKLVSSHAQEENSPVFRLAEEKEC